jgi:Tol biopolymer transport system component
LNSTPGRKSFGRTLGSVPLFVLLIFPCFAQAQSGIDPGFDSDPVEIPTAAKTAPRAVTSMDLLTLRDIHGIQLSPDGKYVAFVLGQAVYETNHYRSGMFVIGTEKGSKPIGLGTAGPPRWTDINEWLPDNPIWSQDSRFIYHTMKSDGSWQVWRWAREGGRAVQITRATHDVQRVSLSPDGRSLVLTVETPTKADRKKLSEQGILYDGSFEATGQSITDRLVATPGGESETWIHDLASGSMHRASAEEQRALETSANAALTLDGAIISQVFSKKEIQEQGISAFNISPDRKKVAYVRYETDSSKSEWGSTYLLIKSTDTGVPVTLTHWPSYPGLYWWSADSKELYFTEDQEDDPADAPKSKIVVAPANGGTPHAVWETADFLGLSSTDRSGRLLACVLENDSTPSEITFTDLSTGENRILVEANPELQNLIINHSQGIDAFDTRGNRYWGHLVLPVGYEPGKRYPLVITTYVDYGGFLRGGVGDEYPVHVFAANGFGTLMLLAFTVQSPTMSEPPSFCGSRLWRPWNAPRKSLIAWGSSTARESPSQDSVTEPNL